MCWKQSATGSHSPQSLPTLEGSQYAPHDLHQGSCWMLRVESKPAFPDALPQVSRGRIP